MIVLFFMLFSSLIGLVYLIFFETYLEVTGVQPVLFTFPPKILLMVNGMGSLLAMALLVLFFYLLYTHFVFFPYFWIGVLILFAYLLVVTLFGSFLNFLKWTLILVVGVTLTVVIYKKITGYFKKRNKIKT